MDASTRITVGGGRTMPVMGLGTWRLVNDTAETVADAVAAGYRLIDTASDYGSQPGIGAALQRVDVPREDLFVVTKIEETDEPVQGLVRDLSELGLGYADLTLIHRPPEEGAGVQLWDGLIRAQGEGLVRDIGVSNYPAALVDRLAEETGVMPAVNQVEWTPFGHDRGLRDHHRAAGIVLMAWSPLTRGERLGDGVLRDIARRHGKTPAQVLIRWNLQAGVVPIPKANRLDHCRENLDVLDFALDEAEIARLDALNAHWSALGALSYLAQG
jgi:2,5-diketo-D-gluconate reductase A